VLNQNRSITLRSTLAALACAAAGIFSHSAAAEQVIRITGIPDENPTELQRKYQPLVNHLEKKLGVKVSYVPVIDYGAAVSALSAGKIDFAWLGGFTHVQARIMAGAQPVVMRDIDRKFKSVLIANTGAGINRPEEVRGKTFAFGSKSSTSGHLMPRHFLMTTLRIDPDKDFAGLPLFSGAHDATVKLVESGKVQAGALNADVWERMNEGNKFDKQKVKLVWITPEYVDYVWTARKDLSVDIVNKFREAFLALDPKNPEHKAVLELQSATQFVNAVPADFDAIERVGKATGLLK
jgi:phosphonate transport system substrate-binding protein